MSYLVNATKPDEYIPLYFAHLNLLLDEKQLYLFNIG